MKYIKLYDNIPKHYTIEELFQDYPDAVIYKKSKMPNEQLLTNYNVYPLITTDKPITTEDSVAEEGTPNKIGTRWYQTWNIRKLTETEITAKIEKEKLLHEELINQELDSDKEQGFLVDSEIQEERYSICKACPSFTLLKTCKECGCIMPLKTRLSSASCPLEKW